MADGRCACGSITYRATGSLRPVINCHCDRCRHWTGHHMAASSADSDAITVDDPDGLLRWWVPDEEPAVAYGFCSRCGSGLFWRSTDRPGTVSITAGSLDTPTGLRTAHALFVDEASDYHDLDESLPSHPGDSGGGVKLDGD
ncbi:MAG: GFA family protein [Acidimicrobiales bacterium]